MSELPEGWAEVSLGEVIESMKNGLYKPRDSYSEDGVACLRMYNIDSGKIIWKDIKRMRLSVQEVEDYQLRSGDLLVNRVNSRELVGKAAVIPNQIEKCVFESKNIRVRLLGEGVLPEIANYQLLMAGASYFSHNAQQVVGMASISQPQIASFPFLLPPLAEQRRIVAKLETLLGKVDACQQRLAKIPVLLKRFRQAVLAAACSGELTVDWRQTNSEVDVVKPPFANDESHNLPLTWASVQVGAIIEGLKYGTSQKCDYEEKGVPVLRIPNIGDGVIDQSDLKYAELSAKEQTQLKLVPGDILLIRSNGSVSLVGKTALVREAESGFAYAGYLIRLRPNKSLADSAYLNLALSSYETRLQIELTARSTSGVNNINSDEVKELRISLPPLAEQQEIVRRVEALFQLADQLEARYQRAQAQVDKLQQSILAKAFRGELVPTEAELARREGRDYEPAAALLERICAAQPSTARKTKSDRTPAQTSFLS